MSSPIRPVSPDTQTSSLGNLTRRVSPPSHTERVARSRCVNSSRRCPIGWTSHGWSSPVTSRRTASRGRALARWLTSVDVARVLDCATRGPSMPLPLLGAELCAGPGAAACAVRGTEACAEAGAAGMSRTSARAPRRVRMSVTVRRVASRRRPARPLTSAVRRPVTSCCPFPADPSVLAAHFRPTCQLLLCAGRRPVSFCCGRVQGLMRAVHRQEMGSSDLACPSVPSCWRLFSGRRGLGKGSARESLSAGDRTRACAARTRARRVLR